MRIESASAAASASGAFASAEAHASTDVRRAQGGDNRGSHGPKRGSGGPKAEGQHDNGHHWGQIKKLAREAAEATASAGATSPPAAPHGPGGGQSASHVDVAALQGLADRLNGVISGLDNLTNVVSAAVGTGSSAASTSTGGATSGAGGAGGAGGTGGTGSTGTTSSAGIVYTQPFHGSTDFGSITINGVDTQFGIMDAAGGMSAAQVAGSLVNIINSNPDQTVTAQRRDDRILLVSKTQGSAISIDNLNMGTAGEGTMAGFTGFFEGMTGSGTMMSNAVQPMV